MGLFSNIFGKKESKPSEPKKERLEDFFKIDIRDIFKYEPKYSYEKEVDGIKKISEDGEVLDENVKEKHYDLRLKELELGTFYKVEILQSYKDSYILKFEGRNEMITNELYEFINFCFEKYGYDDMGNGKITTDDFQLFVINRFGRFWDDVQMYNEGGEMTLYLCVDNLY